MKTLLIAIAVLLGLPGMAAASEGGYPLDHAPINIHDQASLQRGAKLFVNYCMGCHSAQFQRYNRLGRDLGLSEEEVQKNLIFTPDTKLGDTMKIAMPNKQAKAWFGAAPPDLSVMTRARGADYIYTYLRSFYMDEKRPWGVNNAVFPAVGMPHVLWELQGWQEPEFETIDDGHGNKTEVISHLKLVKTGSMTPPEFDAAMGDLVNFMAYIAEPAKLERERLGWWVLGYLVIAFAVFYPLKKEYWKDIH